MFTIKKYRKWETRLLSQRTFTHETCQTELRVCIKNFELYWYE